MSNLAPCLPSVWDEWIGPSSARTLIAMECRASADLRRALHGSNPDASHSATWPSDEEQHLFVLPVWQASGVVWLSGRAFLVGTPTGVVTHLDPNRYPNNVVLLTWSDAHVAGFREYAVEWSRVNTDKTKKLVVWTSDWVWEHVLDMFAHGDLPMSRLHVQTFDTDDIEHVEHFAPRTSMAMTYSVGSSSPELCAHFRLFDSHLIVGLDRAQENCSRPLGLLDVSTYQTLMSRIYDWYPQSRQLMARMLQRRIKQLSDASIMAPLSCARGGWWYRFSLWEGTVERVLRPECGQGSGACGPGVACSYVTEVIEVNEFAEEVSSRSIATFPCDLPSVDSGDGDACNRWNAKNFQKFADSFSIPAAAAPPDEAYKSDHDLHNLKPVSLVIGCGAPPTRWCGNINPDRRIVLGEQDVSVLECKLCQYAELRHRGSKVFSDRVWVLVSPATESVVREELARFWREYKTSLNGAEYRILRNRVVPRFETSETTGVRYFRQNDDGFQYNPAGHFDLLWCLMNEDGLEGLFYYTNLTNLGINVTDEVAVLRSHLVATEAVAVFELVLHDDTKNGMGSGSYWIRRNNGAKALIKPVYCGEEREGQGWQSDRNKVVVRDTEDSTLYMSTGSVLINAESFCSLWVELDQFPWFARPRRPLRTPSSNRIDESGWSVQLERDLDQITWVGNARCSGVVIPPPNGRRRFFAVKRERDLYQASYEELRGLYNGLPFFRAGASQTGGLPASAPPPHAPLALVPAEQHDPWGNGLLRFKKDLPRSDVQISETWESSAYPLGMSRVERNTLESIPLSDVDPELGRQMNVMSKLLDCDGNLSIQIHPSDSVCQVLRSAGLALQDDVGKEENFYVIKVAEPSVFYLGLNADKVFGTFGYRNASSETEPFTYILHRKRDKITAFATSLLSSGGEDIFLQLLQDGIEGTARRGLAGQKILDLRSEAKMPQTDPALAGILFILALRALREALSGAPSSLSGAPSSLSGAPSRKPDFNQVLLSYLNNLEKLEAGQMVRVEPGMPHAAGPGCYLVEASNQSDNTFRIFDHGREYEPEARPVHYDEAAVALCDESFLDKDKEKRHIYRLGVESTGGVVPMKILRPDTLERGDSFACQKGGAHGHTILCTEGRITISVEPQGGVPHEMTIASAHSAYLRHTAKPFKVRSVEHHTSSCAIVCSHSAEPQPELAIAIGVTHVYFVYRAYPNPPEERLFVWYEKMLFGGDFSWQRRLEVFRNELAEFLKQVCQEPRRPISLTTLSWPGPIWEKTLRVDATRVPGSEMKAHALDCRGTTLSELVGGIPGISYDSCWVMFDAAADIAAELKEFGGRLQDEHGNAKPGLLLNFASVVCMAVAGKGAPPVFTVKDRKGDDLHISRIGQMFWFDPLTRDWFIWRASEEEAPSHPLEDLPSRVICLNDLLSTTAVVFRFLSENIGKDFLSEHQTRLWWQELNVCRSLASVVHTSKRASEFQNLIDRYRPHLNAATKDVFDWIPKENSKDKVKQFVVEIGRDYGDMLAALYDELPNLCDMPTVVLGGFGGTHFGSTESDSFLNTVNEELCFHKRSGRVQSIATVVRAQASASSQFLLRANQWGNLF